MSGDVRVRRLYDEAPYPVGAVFLVERLWPRGLRREALRPAAWLPGVAPSSELRRWFAHDPQRWVEFCRRYADELDAAPMSWQPLAEAAHSGGVTLLFSARDRHHNNAVALADYLRARRG